MRPFFYYYGGKYRAAPLYPRPRYQTIVEPFAGAAGYATRYPDRDVILCDAYKVVADLWRWLIVADPGEILGLPNLEPGQRVSELVNVRPEARSLIGFWCNQGSAMPKQSPGAFCGWGPRIRERIAGQVQQIRHWYVVDDYREMINGEATWFVDPPYQGRAGSYYVKHDVDYSALARWCRGREGQVIVCENEGADWLPFKTFATIRGASGKHRTGISKEVVWINDGDGADHEASAR